MSFEQMTPGLQLGEWVVICDVCGFKKRSSQIRKRWDGLMVCKEDYEVRHPQEFVRPRPDNQSVPWTSPEPSDLTTDVTYEDTGVVNPDGTGTFNNEL